MRRSWETERSSAVFSSSLRRSASASIASACMRSLSRARAASSASARSASARRCSASAARARASSASVPLCDRRDHEDRQGDQFAARRRSRSGATGGMWNQLKASALSERRRAARAAVPRRSRSAASPADEDDAERDRRGHGLERVDEQRPGGDRHHRGEQAEPGGRRLAPQPECRFAPAHRLQGTEG